MKEILDRLLAGEISVEEALRGLEADRVAQLDELARLDPDRMRRKGVPEVILAQAKTPEVTARLTREMLSHAGVALVSRVSPAHDSALSQLARATGTGVDQFGSGRRLRGPGVALPEAPRTGGVGLLAAGTADIDVAEEARMVAETMGVRVLRAYDVGMSALHRLSRPLARMVTADLDAYVVVAGMEGALPTLVASLIAAPVIAVPTSVGYGAGGGGLAALLAMLQSCSPGVTVVNIDNGVGAGAAAALIASRARRHVEEPRSTTSDPNRVLRRKPTESR